MRDILPKIGSIALLFLFLFSNQSHAQFSVTGTTPAANALDVAVNSDITITFSADVDAASVSSSTIVIRSEQEGAVAGSFSVSGNSVTFNPTDNFRNGDRIYTTVTTGVTNTSGDALDASHTFGFTTKALPGPESPPDFADFTVSTAAFVAISVAAADIDGDGDLDLASASDVDNKIAWYENDGTGTFGPQQVVSTAADAAWSVAAADIDGDGDLDLASASDVDDKIAWYENKDVTPPEIVAGQKFTVAEASVLGTEIGIVQATDNSSLVNWTIVDGNTDHDGDGNTPFVINSNTGDLLVNDSDDITFDSGAQLYELTLTVDDVDGNTSPLTPVDVLVEAVNVSVTGTAGFDGWRFLGTPSTGQAYNSLLSGVWTQGAAGASTTSGTSNVMRWDEPAQQFVAVTDLTQTISNGAGFIAYLYEDDDPGTAGVDGGWPKTLDASGGMATGTINFPVSYSNGPEPSLDGFNLVANPYPISINWEQGGWTRTNINDAIYIWDPNANSGNGAYKQRVGGTGDNINVIAPFQAFWVQAGTNNPVLSVSEEAKVDGGTFLREAGDGRPEAGVLGLTISAGDFEDRMYVSFRPGGELEQDSLDAVQLASLAGRSLELPRTGCLWRSSPCRWSWKLLPRFR